MKRWNTDTSRSHSQFFLVLVLFALLFGITPFSGSQAAAQVTTALIDLSIDRNISDITAGEGEEVQWQLQITNMRSEDAGVDGVLVNEILSAHLTFIEAVPSQGSCTSIAGSSTEIHCELGHLATDSTASISVTARVKEGFEQTHLSSTAYVSNQSGKVDPFLENNVSVLTISIVDRWDFSELLVSPLCTFTNGNLLVTGQGLRDLARDGLDITIGEHSATGILLGDTSLSILVPEIEPGMATILINGEPLGTQVEINPDCAIRPIDADQLRAGLVPGELMIFFKEGITQEEIDQFKAEYNFASLIKYPLLGFYRGRLTDETLENNSGDGGPGQICTPTRQDQYPELNLVLLVDISGTMDAIMLRQMMQKLIDTLDCALNDNSKVGLMSYSNEPNLIFPLTQWADQRENLLEWINGPIAIGGLSNLSAAILEASASLNSSTDPNIDRSIFLLTRGLSVPVIEDPAEIETSLHVNQTPLAGIAFTNIFFSRNLYEPLENLIAQLGRHLLYFDERMPLEMDRVAVCSVVIGIYNVDHCGPEPLEQIPLVERIEIDPTQRMMDLISKDFRIDQVCLNQLVEAEQMGDPQVADQTWLQILGVENIESYFPRLGNGVTIAVIDTGVDLGVAQSGEIDVNASVPEGISFAVGQDGPGNASDVAGHGTKVASVSAAAGNNGLNGIGVAPRATVIPIRVFASTESGVKGNSLWVAEALASAYLMGADVINLSLGDRSRINVGCQKVSSKDFYERVFANLGIIAEQNELGKTPIIVAATGNDARRIRCPACVEEIIAVGSVRLNDNGEWERSPFSNYGDEIDFVAQGDNILTTLQGGGFGDTGPGTSFSAPQVTGLIALMLGENPHWTTEDVFERIKLCFSEDLLTPGWDEETGWGRIIIPAPSDALPECLSNYN